MAPYDGRIEGVDPTAVSLANGRIEHLPEKSDSAGTETVGFLIRFWDAKTAASLDITSISPCHAYGNVV